MRIVTQRKFLAILISRLTAWCYARGFSLSEDSEGGTDNGLSDGPPVTEEAHPVSYDIQTLRVTLERAAPEGGIPAIDEPVFIEANETDDIYLSGDPIVGFTIDGKARTYPHRILVHHKIVNDSVAGAPIAVTYCPLTATA